MEGLTMGKDTADVTVHIDETLEHSKLQEIADEIRKIDGVDSVSFHDDKPHLMIVQYDPNQTDSSSIHQTVTATGVHAELLGL
jgi:cell division protein FtsX